MEGLPGLLIPGLVYLANKNEYAGDVKFNVILWMLPVDKRRI